MVLRKWKHTEVEMAQWQKMIQNKEQKQKTTIEKHKKRTVFSPRNEQ